MALIQRENGVNELVRELYQAWKCIAIYENLEGIYILFYCIKKAEPVYKILKDSQILCSVSEPFEEFSMCSRIILKPCLFKKRRCICIDSP